MKPTPDGFGAWSCQKLGVLFFAPDRQTLIQEDSPEGLEAIRGFEHGINEVAAIAAAAAVHEHGGALSEDERKTCSAAAFAAARSALKGDNVDVPEFCHAIVEAAQAALARYADADARVAALNPGVDALLAAYNEGVNQPPAVPPSELGGLEPDQEMRRDAACMRGEGSGCTDTGRAPISSPLATEACDNVVEVIEKAKAAEATFKSNEYLGSYEVRHEMCVLANRTLDQILNISAVHCPAKKRDLDLIEWSILKNKCSEFARARNDQCRTSTSPFGGTGEFFWRDENGIRKRSPCSSSGGGRRG